MKTLNPNEEDHKWRGKTLTQIINMIDDEGIRVAFKALLDYLITGINDSLVNVANASVLGSVRSRVDNLEDEIKQLKVRLDGLSRMPVHTSRIRSTEDLDSNTADNSIPDIINRINDDLAPKG